MRTKKVNRYWCDYCNKAGLQAGAMRSHENHCTLNPNRECRVCALLADGQDLDFQKKSLPELMSLLPEYVECNSENTWEEGKLAQASIELAVGELRNATGDCPACMMAALRQKGIPVPSIEGFNFTREMKQIFSDINDAKADERYY